MVHLLQCRRCSGSVHKLFLFSILLLLTSSMAVAFSDASDTRRLPLMLQPEDKEAVAADDKQPLEAGGGRRSRSGETTEARRRRGLIGSRPPRCERVCMSCGHCEAVQVPIVPQHEEEKARASASAVTLAAAMFTYRVDGISNYKPLSWKCRCGGTILDP
ncbi:EPIDERMAL PATTERNING FACTOR-like protein 2 [Sorghum bicolor]|uniref:Epidermal patterning factor-like protein n=1 Tax=Sorghum bicolor TaxID=4558 RepID=A0A1B6Q8U7_SORBI|nr:EPIDERMAL PATTERNING FACTOR-like protein 2 [Sorghum bicolor]KXG34342.1 hypothetical protein SORBI_3002G025300 [Sorghum bicolor]|eukprot:XP_002459315.2 EPIDERMAL PATTERNING FACTOR-like protein 2 [Sorghum bicolor]